MRLALYKGSGLISKTICWHTRSDFSHVGIELADGSIIEAWHKGGVRQRPSLLDGMEKTVRVDVLEFVAPITQTQEEAAESFLKAQLGKKYDWRAIGGFLTRNTTAEDRRNSDRWICSELAFVACAKADRLLQERKAAWMINPDHVSMSPLLRLVRSVTP